MSHYTLSMIYTITSNRISVCGSRLLFVLCAPFSHCLLESINEVEIVTLTLAPIRLCCSSIQPHDKVFEFFACELWGFSYIQFDCEPMLFNISIAFLSIRSCSSSSINELNLVDFDRGRLFDHYMPQSC